MGERQRLDQEYRNTVFWVELPHRYLPLRIGQHDAHLAGFLRENEVGEWALLTAWNPRSRLLTPLENRERQQSLLVRLRERGWRLLPAIGVGDQPDWPPEESVLVLGLGGEEAKRIAQEEGQNTIVTGNEDGTPQLLWCLEPS